MATGFSSYGSSSSVVGSAQFEVATDLTKLDAGLVEAERKVSRSMNKITKVMTGAGAAAVAGMTAAFGKFFNDAVKQQHAFAETFTLLPNTTEKEFAQIERQAKQLAARMNVEWKDMSEGLYNAISAGVEMNDVISFMEQASMAATGGVATLNQAVNLGTTAVNAMAAQGYEASEAFDILFSTVRKGKTTIPELASSIGFLLPVANAYKISLEEVGAAVATLTAAGIRTRVSMTAIRAGLGELTDPAYKAGKALEEVTGQTFNELKKSGKDIGEILNTLYKAVGQETFSRLFGLESRAGMLALIDEGYEAYKENLEATINSAGATEAAFEKMAGTIRFQMGQAGKILNQTFINIAAQAIPLVENLFDDKLLPAIEKFSQWFINNEETISKWFEDTWNTVYPVVEDFIGGITTITKATWELVSFITENKALMIGALGAIGIAMTSAFGPAAPIIVGVGMLITLLGDLKEKWDAIVEAAPNATWFQHGQKLVAAVGEGIASGAVSLYNALLEALQSLRNLLPFSDAKEGPLSDLTASGAAIPKAIAEGVKQEYVTIRNAVYESLHFAYTDFTSLLPNWYTAGHNLVVTMAEGIAGGATYIYNSVVEIFKGITALFPASDAKKGPLSNLTRSGKNIILTLANGVRISSTELSDEIRDALGEVERLLLSGDGLPTEEEMRSAIKNKVDFTTIVAGDKGIIKSIDWEAGRVMTNTMDKTIYPWLQKGGKVFGDGLTSGVGDATRLAASGVGEAQKKAAAARKKAKEDADKLKYGSAGGSAETARKEAEKAIEEAQEAIEEGVKNALLPEFTADDANKSFEKVIDWIADHVAAVAVWIPTWEEIQLGVEKTFFAVRDWIKNNIGDGNSWVPSSTTMLTLTQLALGRALQWMRDAILNLFFVEDITYGEDFELQAEIDVLGGALGHSEIEEILGPPSEWERQVLKRQKRLVFFPDFTEEDLNNVFGVVADWVQETFTDPWHWVPTGSELLNAAKIAFGAVFSWVATGLKSIFLVDVQYDDPEFSFDKYQEEFYGGFENMGKTQRRLWFFPDISEQDIDDFFKNLITPSNWLPTWEEVKAQADLTFLGLSSWIKTNIGIIKNWLPTKEEFAGAIRSIFIVDVPLISGDLGLLGEEEWGGETEARLRFFPTVSISDIEDAFGGVKDWIKTTIADPFHWLPTREDMQKAFRNLFFIEQPVTPDDPNLLGESEFLQETEYRLIFFPEISEEDIGHWLKENVAKATSWLPTWEDIKETADLTFLKLVSWIETNIGAAKNWLPTFDEAQIDIENSFFAVRSWIRERIANPELWLPPHKVMQNFMRTLFMIKIPVSVEDPGLQNEFDWMGGPPEESYRLIFFPEITEADVWNTFGIIHDWIETTIADPFHWVPTPAEALDGVKKGFSTAITWIGSALKELFFVEDSGIRYDVAPYQGIEETYQRVWFFPDITYDDVDNAFKEVTNWIKRAVRIAFIWLPIISMATAGVAFGSILLYARYKVKRADEWLPTWADVKLVAGLVFRAAKNWIIDNVATAAVWLPTLVVRGVAGSVAQLFGAVLEWTEFDVKKPGTWLPTLKVDDIGIFFNNIIEWAKEKIQLAATWLPTISLDEVGPFFENVLTWVKNEFNKAGTWLPVIGGEEVGEDWLPKITTKDVETAFGTVGEMIQTLLSPSDWLPTSQEMKTAAGIAFAGIVDWVAENFTNVAEHWFPKKTILDSGKDLITEALDTAFKPISTWIDDNIAKATSWLPTSSDITSTVGTIFSGAKSWIKDNIGSAFTWLPFIGPPDLNKSEVQRSGFLGLEFEWMDTDPIDDLDLDPATELNILKIQAEAARVFGEVKNWIESNVATIKTWLPSKEDIETNVAAQFDAIKTWITDNVATVDQWLPTSQDVRTSVENIFNTAKLWIGAKIGDADVWLPTWWDIRLSVSGKFNAAKDWINENIANPVEWLPTKTEIENKMAGSFDAAKEWISDNVADAKEWLPTWSEIETRTNLRFEAARGWIATYIGKATEWMPTFDSIGSWSAILFQAAIDWINANVAKAKEWLPSYNEVTSWMGYRFEAAKEWLGENVAKAKEWLPSWQDIYDGSKTRFSAVKDWIGEKISIAREWLPTYNDILTTMGVRFDAVVDWIGEKIAIAREWLPSFNDIKTTAKIRFDAVIDWIKENIALAKEWLPGWLDIYSFMQYTFGAAKTWIDETIANASLWLPSRDNFETWAGVRLEGVKAWIKENIARWDVWFPFLGKETLTDVRLREERIARGEEYDLTEDHPIIQSIGPLIRILGLTTAQTQALAVLGDMKIWELTRHFGPWNTVTGVDGKPRERVRSPEGVGVKGKVANMSVASIVSWLLGRGVNLAQWQLIDLWFPHIAGDDLETRWGEARDWIRENISDAWLSDDTKTTLNSLTNFLISAGMEGGFFHTLGTQIQELTVNVEDLKNVTKDGIDLQFNFASVAAEGMQNTGEGILRGVEIGADTILGEGMVSSMLALAFTRFKWVRKVAFTKTNFWITVGIVVVGMLDRFVLEPKFGKDPAYEDEPARLAFFRRLISPLFGEDAGAVASGIVNEEGGFLKYVWKFFVTDPLAWSFGTDAEKAKMLRDRDALMEERIKTYSKDSELAIRNFVSNNYPELNESEQDALVLQFMEEARKPRKEDEKVNRFRNTQRQVSESWWFRFFGSWNEGIMEGLRLAFIGINTAVFRFGNEGRRQKIAREKLNGFFETVFYMYLPTFSLAERFREHLDGQRAGPIRIIKALFHTFYEGFRLSIINALDSVLIGEERTETAKNEFERWIPSFIYKLLPSDSMAENFKEHLDEHGEGFISVISGVFLTWKESYRQYVIDSITKWRADPWGNKEKRAETARNELEGLWATVFYVDMKSDRQAEHFKEHLDKHGEGFLSVISGLVLSWREEFRQRTIDNMTSWFSDPFGFRKERGETARTDLSGIWSTFFYMSLQTDRQAEYFKDHLDEHGEGFLSVVSGVFVAWREEFRQKFINSATSWFSDPGGLKKERGETARTELSGIWSTWFYMGMGSDRQAGYFKEYLDEQGEGFLSVISGVFISWRENYRQDIIDTITKWRADPWGNKEKRAETARNELSGLWATAFYVDMGSDRRAEIFKEHLDKHGEGFLSVISGVFLSWREEFRQRTIDNMTSWFSDPLGLKKERGEIARTDLSGIWSTFFYMLIRSDRQAEYFKEHLNEHGEGFISVISGVFISWREEFRQSIIDSATKWFADPFGKKNNRSEIARNELDGLIETIVYMSLPSDRAAELFREHLDEHGGGLFGLFYGIFASLMEGMRLDYIDKVTRWYFDPFGKKKGRAEIARNELDGLIETIVYMSLPSDLAAEHFREKLNEHGDGLFGILKSTLSAYMEEWRLDYIEDVQGMYRTYPFADMEGRGEIAKTELDGFLETLVYMSFPSDKQAENFRAYLDENGDGFFSIIRGALTAFFTDLPSTIVDMIVEVMPGSDTFKELFLANFDESEGGFGDIFRSLVDAIGETITNSLPGEDDDSMFAPITQAIHSVWDWFWGGVENAFNLDGGTVDGGTVDVDGKVSVDGVSGGDVALSGFGVPQWNQVDDEDDEDRDKLDQIQEDAATIILTSWYDKAWRAYMGGQLRRTLAGDNPDYDPSSDPNLHGDSAGDEYWRATLGPNWKDYFNFTEDPETGKVTGQLTEEGIKLWDYVQLQDKLQYGKVVMDEKTGLPLKDEKGKIVIDWKSTEFNRWEEERSKIREETYDQETGTWDMEAYWSVDPPKLDWANLYHEFEMLELTTKAMAETYELATKKVEGEIPPSLSEFLKITYGDDWKELVYDESGNLHPIVQQQYVFSLWDWMDNADTRKMWDKLFEEALIPRADGFGGIGKMGIETQSLYQGLEKINPDFNIRDYLRITYGEDWAQEVVAKDGGLIPEAEEEFKNFLKKFITDIDFRGQWDTTLQEAYKKWIGQVTSTLGQTSAETPDGTPTFGEFSDVQWGTEELDLTTNEGVKEFQRRIEQYNKFIEAWSSSEELREEFESAKAGLTVDQNINELLSSATPVEFDDYIKAEYGVSWEEIVEASEGKITSDMLLQEYDDFIALWVESQLGQPGDSPSGDGPAPTPSDVPEPPSFDEYFDTLLGPDWQGGLSGDNGTAAYDAMMEEYTKFIAAWTGDTSIREMWEDGIEEILELDPWYFQGYNTDEIEWWKFDRQPWWDTGGGTGETGSITDVDDPVDDPEVISSYEYPPTFEEYMDMLFGEDWYGGGSEAHEALKEEYAKFADAWTTNEGIRKLWETGGGEWLESDPWYNQGTGFDLGKIDWGASDRQPWWMRSYGKNEGLLTGVEIPEPPSFEEYVAYLKNTLTELPEDLQKDYLNFIANWELEEETRLKWFEFIDNFGKTGDILSDVNIPEPPTFNEYKEAVFGKGVIPSETELYDIKDSYDEFVLEWTSTDGKTRELALETWNEMLSNRQTGGLPDSIADTDIPEPPSFEEYVENAYAGGSYSEKIAQRDYDNYVMIWNHNERIRQEWFDYLEYLDNLPEPPTFKEYIELMYGDSDYANPDNPVIYSQIQKEYHELFNNWKYDDSIRDEWDEFVNGLAQQAQVKMQGITKPLSMDEYFKSIYGFGDDWKEGLTKDQEFDFQAEYDKYLLDWIANKGTGATLEGMDEILDDILSEELISALGIPSIEEYGKTYSEGASDNTNLINDYKEFVKLWIADPKSSQEIWDSVLGQGQTGSQGQTGIEDTFESLGGTIPDPQSFKEYMEATFGENYAETIDAGEAAELYNLYVWNYTGDMGLDYKKIFGGIETEDTFESLGGTIPDPIPFEQYLAAVFETAPENILGTEFEKSIYRHYLRGYTEIHGLDFDELFGPPITGDIVDVGGRSSPGRLLPEGIADPPSMEEYFQTLYGDDWKDIITAGDENARFAWEGWLETKSNWFDDEEVRKEFADAVNNIIDIGPDDYEIGDYTIDEYGNIVDSDGNTYTGAEWFLMHKQNKAGGPRRLSGPRQRGLPPPRGGGRVGGFTPWTDPTNPIPRPSLPNPGTIGKFGLLLHAVKYALGIEDYPLPSSPAIDIGRLQQELFDDEDFMELPAHLQAQIYEDLERQIIESHGASGWIFDKSMKGMDWIFEDLLGLSPGGMEETFKAIEANQQKKDAGDKGDWSVPGTTPFSAIAGISPVFSIVSSLFGSLFGMGKSDEGIPEEDKKSFGELVGEYFSAIISDFNTVIKERIAGAIAFILPSKELRELFLEKWEGSDKGYGDIFGSAFSSILESISNSIADALSMDENNTSIFDPIKSALGGVWDWFWGGISSLWGDGEPGSGGGSGGVGDGGLPSEIQGLPVQGMGLFGGVTGGGLFGWLPRLFNPLSILEDEDRKDMERVGGAGILHHIFDAFHKGIFQNWWEWYRPDWMRPDPTKTMTPEEKKMFEEFEKAYKKGLKENEEWEKNQGKNKGKVKGKGKGGSGILGRGMPGLGGMGGLIGGGYAGLLMHSFRYAAGWEDDITMDTPITLMHDKLRELYNDPEFMELSSSERIDIISKEQQKIFEGYTFNWDPITSWVKENIIEWARENIVKKIAMGITGLFPGDELTEMFTNALGEREDGSITKSLISAIAEYYGMADAFIENPSLLNLVIGFFHNIILNFADGIKNIFTGESTLLDPIKEALGGVWDTFAEDTFGINMEEGFLKGLWEKITGMFSMESLMGGFGGDASAMGTGGTSVIGEMLSKLPMDIQSGIAEGAMQGFFESGGESGILPGAIKGALQGMIQWISNKISEIELDWTSVREAVFAQFNPVNWFDTGAAGEGEDPSGFASLLPSWTSVLNDMAQSVLTWVTDLPAKFLPEGADSWKAVVEDKFSGMIEGAGTIVSGITGKFESMETTLLGIFEDIKIGWNSIIDKVSETPILGKLTGYIIDYEKLKFDLGGSSSSVEGIRGGGGGPESPSEIRAYHSGGIALTPQIATLAEKGKPEVVLTMPKLMTLGSIMARHAGLGQTMSPGRAYSGGRAGSGKKVVINVEGDVYGYDDFADRVGEAFVDLDREGKLDLRYR